MTREEAKNILTSILHTDGDYMDYLDSEDVEAIKFLASDERPHGKWEFVGENLFMCTHCGYSAKGDYLREWSVHTYDSTFPDFCPNCGASMQANDRQVR